MSVLTSLGCSSTAWAN